MPPWPTLLSFRVVLSLTHTTTTTTIRPHHALLLHTTFCGAPGPRGECSPRSFGDVLIGTVTGITVYLDSLRLGSIHGDLERIISPCQSIHSEAFHPHCMWEDLDLEVSYALTDYFPEPSPPTTS